MSKSINGDWQINMASTHCGNNMVFSKCDNKDPHNFWNVICIFFLRDKIVWNKTFSHEVNKYVHLFEPVIVIIIIIIQLHIFILELY